MSRPSTSSEARTHAIYAQLGVTFIQCYDQGKDTADKKIISDMWKFYAQYQKTSPNMRTRIILLTGDRDFADAIGQLRNFGVEVGILTGKVTETAPVYDDYTLGMRVLPLMGVIEARARDIDLNAYQAGKRISLDTFDKSSERMFSRLRRLMIVGGSVEDFRTEGDTRALREHSATVDSKISQDTKETKSADPKTSQDIKEIESVDLKTSQDNKETKSVDPKTTQDTKADADIKTDISHPPTSVVTGMNVSQSKPPPKVNTKEQEQVDVSIRSEIKNQGAPTAETKPTQLESTTVASEAAAVKSKVSTTKADTTNVDMTAPSAPTEKPATDSKAVTDLAKDENSEKILDSKISATPQEGGFFSRLRKALAFTKNKTTQVPPTSAVGTKNNTMQTEEPGKTAPPTYSQAKETKSEESPQAMNPNLTWTPPSTSHVTAPPIPIQTSIFSSTPLVPPTMKDYYFKPVPAAASFSTCPAEMTSDDVNDFLTKEVLAKRPAGISEPDMQRLFSAWLNIVRWDGEINPQHIRKAARRALRKAWRKASEIVTVRKELREKKAEEQIVEKEREFRVFEKALGGEKTPVYSLIKDLVEAPQATVPSQKPTETLAHAQASKTAPKEVNNIPANLPQSSTKETKQPENHTLVPQQEKEVQAVNSPTPLIPHPPRRPGHPTPAGTISGLVSRTEAAERAWLNEEISQIEFNIYHKD